MDTSTGIGSTGRTGSEIVEQRAAPRFISLIRSAKLVCTEGEFMCVIRDVSAVGISLRTFHCLPAGKQISLELQNGETYDIHEMRREGFEASYRFGHPVEVEKLIRESWGFPKRQLRLNIAVPLTLSSLTQSAAAMSLNLSQQGARIKCDAPFAIDQTLRVSGSHLPETGAKVRWRKEANYGLVFENTLSLREFALMAAAMQCPAMLRELPDAA